MSKGNAYIEFDVLEDAESAMLYLDGGQLDGNVLKVSMILVNNRRRESSQGILCIYVLLLLLLSLLLV